MSFCQIRRSWLLAWLAIGTAASAANPTPSANDIATIADPMTCGGDRRAIRSRYLPTDADAQYQLAACYAYHGKHRANQRKAVFWYRQAALQGHALAQWQLADAYANGRGIVANPRQALHWYRAAAQQHVFGAPYQTALRYYRGIGVEPDLAQALYWLWQGERQQDGAAINLLGELYLRGEGVTADAQQAQRLFAVACEQGNPQACVNQNALPADASLGLPLNN